jgi:tRNA A37 threonylcarbamoyladenosine synthetase subunit TsaC/SUA5/YrdC
MGLPTETVYGLGARAGGLYDAVKKIYALKGRPTNHSINYSVIYQQIQNTKNSWLEVPLSRLG